MGGSRNREPAGDASTFWQRKYISVEVLLVGNSSSCKAAQLQSLKALRRGWGGRKEAGLPNLQTTYHNSHGTSGACDTYLTPWRRWERQQLYGGLTSPVLDTPPCKWEQQSWPQQNLLACLFLQLCALTTQTPVASTTFSCTHGCLKGLACAE